MRDKKKLDVSVVVTAHSEGILAHKTMLTVFRAAARLEKSNISYEILIHIDNGTDETKSYFERYKNDKRIKLFHNQFGDLSESRNFTIDQARGSYIALADADDLYSENWLIDFYNSVKGTKDIVARFNYILTFGGNRTIITDLTDLSERDEFLYSFDSNVYGSPCMFHKDIYLTTPQRANHRPFGYEDWQWFLDTKARGIKHVITPGTVLFYRRDPLAKASLLNGQVRDRAALSKTPYFDFSRLKSVLKRWTLDDIKQSLSPPPEKKKITVKGLAKDGLYVTLTYANKFSVYKALRRTIKGGDREIPEYLPEIPEPLEKEWKAINAIEKFLYPDKAAIKMTEFYRPNKRIAIGYLNMVAGCKKRPDTLVLVPWLNPGGADMVFIKTVNEIVKQHSDWSVAVMQTDRSSSPWKNQLSKKVDFVNLDEEFADIDYERQMDIMAAFVIQNDIKRIVIANSMFGYHFAMRYKALIRAIDLKLYVFSFNGVVSDYGRVGGYAHEQLPLIYNVVYKVVTDNSAIAKEMVHAHGYIEDKYNTHHQFVKEKIVPIKNSGYKQSLAVMWAGRIAWQKMPGVLAEVNLRVKDRHRIDVYGKLEDWYDEAFLAKNQLNYKREFNGINDLPTGDYDVFMYTSNADGLPNILLEAATKGLPIIAPNVGGIGDFIKDGETGILIDDCRDVDAYEAALDRLRDGALREKLVKNAQAFLKKEFTPERWKAGVKEIFDR